MTAAADKAAKATADAKTVADKEKASNASPQEKTTAKDAAKAPVKTPEVKGDDGDSESVGKTADSVEADGGSSPAEENAEDKIGDVDFHDLLNVVYADIDSIFEDGPEKTEVLNDLTNLQFKLRAFDS